MIEHIIDFIIVVLDKLGYFGTFIGMGLESACIPIPSEIILPFGGYLCYNGRLNLIAVIVSGTIGGVAGSIGAYYIGKLGGRPLVEKYAEKLHLSKAKIAKSDEYFKKYGEKIVFFSRLMPIIRTFISLPAGISKMDFKKFVTYTAVGSLIWSIVLGYAGYVMGQNWIVIRSWFHIADIIVAAALVCLIIYWIYKRTSSKKETV